MKMLCDAFNAEQEKLQKAEKKKAPNATNGMNFDSKEMGKVCAFAEKYKGRFHSSRKKVTFDQYQEVLKDISEIML